MAIFWARLRRRTNKNVKAADTEPDEQGVHASEDLRERQELRRVLAAERDREARNDGKRTLGYMSGPYG